MALLVLRVTVFLVMFMWTIDKLIRPDHAASVYQHFYFLRGFGPAVMYAIATAEFLILIGFVIGFAPRLTYGAVFLFHAISTLSSFRQYFHPYENVNLLFFADWKMLAACFALYWLRDLDMLWSVRSISPLARESFRSSANASAARTNTKNSAPPAI